ncbi:MAG: hypothetical protein LBQ81_13865 [Zoogloeaceae bacterium]|nr:hypothetical protein [Zoogloeaceae bacterium]
MLLYFRLCRLSPKTTMHRLTALLFCLALSVFSGFSASAHATEDGFRSPDELMFWIENYAGHPEPERIPAAFRSIQSTALVRISSDFVVILGGFFAAAFQRHPERVDAWVAAMERDLNADSAPVFLQTLLLAGLPEVAKRVGLRQPERFQNTAATANLLKSFAELTPEDGEDAILAWWGAFFIDNDAAPVERIIGALHGFPGDKTLSRRKAATLRMAFRSLANFAPKSPRIRAICENALRETDDPQIAEGLRKVLENLPENTVTPVP